MNQAAKIYRFFHIFREHTDFVVKLSHYLYKINNEFLNAVFLRRFCPLRGRRSLVAGRRKPTPNTKEEMNKKESKEKKELARLYYFNGEPQKQIAEKIGVSAVTVGKWVKAESWEQLRAAKVITRRELVARMLSQINDKLESGEWSADEMVKATAAIEKLDKQTNVVTVIEVFSAYNKWLISRMELDPELTPELVKTMNRYQDIFIGEQLNSTNLESR